MVKYGEGYILSVGYYKNPKRNGSNSNPQLHARYIDAKFNKNSWITNGYTTHHSDHLEKNHTRRHVENMIKGPRERKVTNVSNGNQFCDAGIRKF